MQNSPILELNRIISEHNPFLGLSVDRVSTIWGQGLPDVSRHNHHVIDIIDTTLRERKKSEINNAAVQTLAIKADVGMGKTQIFSRIHDQLYLPGKISFSYLSLGGLHDSKFINSWFRKGIVSDLDRQNTSKVSQLQEITAYLVNKVISEPVPVEKLSKNFDKNIKKYQNKDKDLIQILYEKISAVYQDKARLDPYIIKALLWTLSTRFSSFAVRWLAGEEVDQSTAQKMGLISSVDISPEHQELSAIDINTKLLQVFSLAKPLIIGFDELEDCNFATEEGFSKPQVVMNFVKKIYDSTESIGEETRGILLISSLMSGTLESSSSEFRGQGGVLDRISTANNNEFIELQLLNAELGIQIAKVWLKERLFVPLGIDPPTPVYPFKEEDIESICLSKPTPRDFLKWCSKTFKKLTSDTIISDDELFKRELEKLRKVYEEDEHIYLASYEIAEAIQFGMEILSLLQDKLTATTSSGETIIDLKIERVCESVPVENPDSDRNAYESENYINFKILGYDSNGEFTIGVTACNARHHHTILAILKRLSALKRFGLTHSCFVRPEDLKFKGKATIEALENLQNICGEIVDFSYEDFKDIKCLHDLKNKVTEEQLEFHSKSLEELILQHEIDSIRNNPVLLEILSRAPKSKSVESISDTEDEDDLSLFFDEDDEDDEDDSEKMEVLLN